VRQHLAVLERDELVVYAVQAAPRGRPRHVYRLSERGQEAFPRRYRELAEAVLEELGTHLEGKALAGAMRRMGERAAAGFADEVVPVQGAAQLMKQLGYEATAAGSEIVARNCVFHQLAKRFAPVCEFDLGFMEAATGRKVEHRECIVRGGTCCRFRFSR
jgi:predicted ArsR family transcriptional regulator